jgi:hypothetical protein
MAKWRGYGEGSVEWFWIGLVGRWVVTSGKPRVSRGVRGGRRRVSFIISAMITSCSSGDAATFCHTYTKNARQSHHYATSTALLMMSYGCCFPLSEACMDVNPRTCGIIEPSSAETCSSPSACAPSWPTRVEGVVVVLRLDGARKGVSTLERFLKLPHRQGV